jgi:taurine--2-oxoglutarate transaminase
MQKLAGFLRSKQIYAFSRFNMLWVCPPLVISREELRWGLDVIEEALALVDEALGVVGAAAD